MLMMLLLYAGETVQISTSIPGRVFDYKYNKQCFFSSLGRNINFQVDASNSPVTIGVIASGTNSTKLLYNQ